jgi:hypothetical protein
VALQQGTWGAGLKKLYEPMYGQALPQAPQLLLSLNVSVHLLPQQAAPLPDEQLTPQPPQFPCSAKSEQ